MMRAHRSTLVKLCLLTALAVPVQRAALAATGTQSRLESPELVAQADGASPSLTATSPDQTLTALVDENQVIIEDDEGTLVAGPLETEETVTALAFSTDGRILATGTEAGTVRYWNIDGTPRSDAFPVVLGDDSAVTELAFDGDDRLYAAGSQGRSGFWGPDGLSYGEEVVADAEDTGTASDAEDASPWWWLAPLVALGGIGLWLLSRRRPAEPAEPKRQTAPTATVPPPDDSNGGEVSTRAQSVISTDRVTDESRAVSPIAPAPLPPGPLPIVGLPGVAPESASASVYESTDLESTDLEGTNLDLRPLTADGSGLDSVAIADDSTADVLVSDPETTADEVWDDNLDLTLDEELEEAGVLAAAATIPETPTLPDTAPELDDLWDTAPDDGVINDIDTIDRIEPTRDTVIAETETIPDIEPTRETIISDGAVIFSGVMASTSSEKPALSAPTPEEPAVSGDMSMKDPLPLSAEVLASVDDDLPELPDGYGDSRIVLLPRDPKWAYAYWDVSNAHKEALRHQGGERLMLRLYDVTDIDQSSQSAHSMQQQECHEMARSWYIEMPVSDRDYTIEIGYLTGDDRWLMLTRSAAVRVPPIYPSNWSKDQFRTVGWEDRLEGRTVADLGRPPEDADSATTEAQTIYSALFAAAQGQEAMRVAGSLYSSMQSVPPEALAGDLNVSGLNMSGVGSGGAVMPERSRPFWLVADAELIVYGATEPDATLTVGDRVIPLNADGTFRFHMAFPDGQIDYPIRAVAADGEQTCSISLYFERETPEQKTNTKAEAEEEWF
ncbi:MAG: DUF4912 domain-containing protein [Phormidesmis sp.]